ncbi:MAG: EAL domain-containing protein [Sulfuricellaceae bacterium]|nr:EAL domain-containing protein [Sulfuricellaceae bacterium]
MTLFRQLIIIITALFLAVFVGTFFVSVNNTRVFLSSQLQSHAQDAATSLGLSLSPHAADNDLITMTSMVDAMFDSGYYREIKVVDIDGKPLVVRELPVTIEEVPQWFIQLTPLETPLGEALVMAGWQHAGGVTVRSNPGIAYAKLWYDSIGMFWWLFGAAVITLALGWIILKIVLRPLRNLEIQAEAICRREYPVQEKMPWTRELRSFVQAMNRMVIKVKEMFEEQARAMEKMRAHAYMDSVTGLGNRRHLEAQLQNLINNPEHFAGGALFLLELNGFKEYNDRHGYQAGDDLLRQATALLSNIGGTHPESFCARLGGADFALVVPNIDATEAGAIGKQLSESLQRLHEGDMAVSKEVGNIGIALYRGQDSVFKFLSEADLALRTAQAQGGNAWHLEKPEQSAQTEVAGAQNWSTFLNEVIAQRRITLLFQPVKSCTSESILHYEVLLRLLGSNDQLLSAGVFMPYVNRLGLHREMDRLVVSEIMERMKLDRARDIPAVAINLAPESAHDAAFADWLCEELDGNPEIASKLIFEVTEYGATKNLDSIRSLIDKVSLTGAKFSLDHFGRGFSSFGYLSSLKIHYLKVDGSYIHGIDQDQDDQFFVDAVIKIAHGLDIEVIAESVETAEEWKTLQELNVYGLQGYLVGEPAALL